jgi:hypothetical protein
MSKRLKSGADQANPIEPNDPQEQTVDVELDELGLPAGHEADNTLYDADNAPAPSMREQDHQAAQAARSRPGPRRRAPRRAQVDPSTLKIETDIQIPIQQRRGRVSAWVPVLQQMEVGDSLNIPGTTANKIGYVRLIAKKLGLTVVVRGSEDGARLWRVGPDNFTNDGL